MSDDIRTNLGAALRPMLSRLMGTTIAVPLREPAPPEEPSAASEHDRQQAELEKARRKVAQLEARIARGRK